MKASLLLSVGNAYPNVFISDPYFQATPDQLNS